MIELGLQRISRLLARTPLPWRAVHVAGTNGKGSICAYISSMLETYNSSEYRSYTGFNRWDCITTNQQTVPHQLFTRVENAVHQRNHLENIKASEFELLTATAFQIFTEEKVDIAVVEVGMGGRLDATNIIGQTEDPSHPEHIEGQAFRPPPLVTAISKIGLDHQAFLGDTLSEIAREKAGIFKTGVPVVYDLSNDHEVLTALEDQSDYLETLSVTHLETPFQFLEPGIRHAYFADELACKSADAENATYVPEHTKRNMSVAFKATWIALQQLGRLPYNHNSRSQRESTLLERLANTMIENASQHVRFPGRLQDLNIEHLTGKEQDVLLDGAHNAQSAEVLAAAVNRRRATHPQQARHAGMGVTWVLACSSTKDVDEILRILLRPGDVVYAVEFGPVDGMPWVEPMSSDTIVDAVRNLAGSIPRVEAHACGRDLQSALQKASDGAQGGPMVVAGSLYLVGDVLRLLKNAAYL
ncbi:folylpolyglutamate synthase [Elasticomyces elasticus]|nr:folylpolyglutamate synthase [Elasticomyces elasticus]KAK3667917.1 folylpolyglutamate synthase [Elasticomyces elasticus]KAK5745841.1 folylpolyglutamate synthase [Elasticomyces elasticus]